MRNSQGQHNGSMMLTVMNSNGEPSNLNDSPLTDVTVRAPSESRDTYIKYATADHDVSQRGQQTMHAYGASAPVNDLDPDITHFLPVLRQSEAEWAYQQRHPRSSLTFDLQSMELRTACPPQFTWSARERHGQANIVQHPRRFRHRPNKLVPGKTDDVIDAAHLRSLLQERQVSLSAVVQASRRQTTLDKRKGYTQWNRACTSRLSTALGLTTVWGCTAVTWDSQFTHFVSCESEDSSLGSDDFQEQLGAVSQNSLIFLDNFTETQQRSILTQLEAAPRSHKWMVISHAAARTCVRRNWLRKFAWQADTLLPGQRLLTSNGAWETGDISPAPLTDMCSVWASNSITKADYDSTEEAWHSSPLTAAEITALRPPALAYWTWLQDGQYITVPGVKAACDGSAGKEMGAAAVWQLETDADEYFDSCKVSGPSSSFRAEAAAMHIALLNTPSHKHLTIFTDSMNVIFALQSWHTEEFT